MDTGSVGDVGSPLPFCGGWINHQATPGSGDHAALEFLHREIQAALLQHHSRFSTSQPFPGCDQLAFPPFQLHLPGQPLQNVHFCFRDVQFQLGLLDGGLGCLDLELIRKPADKQRLGLCKHRLRVTEVAFVGRELHPQSRHLRAVLAVEVSVGGHLRNRHVRPGSCQGGLRDIRIRLSQADSLFDVLCVQPDQLGSGLDRGAIRHHIGDGAATTTATIATPDFALDLRVPRTLDGTGFCDRDDQFTTCDRVARVRIVDHNRRRFLEHQLGDCTRNGDQADQQQEPHPPWRGASRFGRSAPVSDRSGHRPALFNLLWRLQRHLYSFLNLAFRFKQSVSGVSPCPWQFDDTKPPPDDVARDQPRLADTRYSRAEGLPNLRQVLARMDMEFVLPANEFRVLKDEADATMEASEEHLGQCPSRSSYSLTSKTGRDAVPGPPTSHKSNTIPIQLHRHQSSSNDVDCSFKQ